MDLTTLVDELAKQVDAVHGGNLNRAETMLISQAHTLDAIFHELARRAGHTIAKFPYFCFDDEAQAIFIEWSTETHQVRLQREDEPLIQQHLAKFDKLFPVLALIFHLVDCSARNVRGPVGKQAALRAAAWCEYLKAQCTPLLRVVEG